MQMDFKVDFLVIGSGIAGLTYALKVSPHGTVAIVTKKDRIESSTNYAQGGIAAVTDANDSFNLHVQDTVTVGDGLCHTEVVEMVIHNAPERIRELADWGVKFSLEEKENQVSFDLGQEGGHSRRRILHARDLTGQEVERVLVEKVEALPQVRIHEHFLAVDLITKKKLRGKGGLKQGEKDVCYGAYVLDVKNHQVHTFTAQATLLATGGSGKVYLYTSNPDISTGDGIAMACRAGAPIANMEFFQFHPTCLYHPEAKNFLISEAVRGEGAVLRLKDGTPFMEHYHTLKDLAPRDIVARAIDTELKKSGDDYVLLDITHRDPAFVKNRFPNIYEKCLAFDIDMTRMPIPVVPAAHYLCGGILTDKNGQTALDRLFAGGEVACTGLHGANRLASNSLLEALVFAHRAAAKSIDVIRTKNAIPRHLPAWDTGNAVNSDESVVVSHNWDEIRRLMWNYVGIVRSDKRLARARRRIQLLKREIDEYYWNFIITSDLIELRNIATVAELIVRCAVKRKESRGLHFNIDYPHKDGLVWERDTVVRKGTR